MKAREKTKIPFWKTALFCVMFVILGAAAGALSKLADAHFELISDITSGMCVWIFICVVICVFTKSPARAAVYVFLFCAAMIAAYYLTAELGDLYYSRPFSRSLSGTFAARESFRGSCERERSLLCFSVRLSHFTETCSLICCSPRELLRLL